MREDTREGKKGDGSESYGEKDGKGEERTGMQQGSAAIAEIKNKGTKRGERRGMSKVKHATNRHKGKDMSEIRTCKDIQVEGQLYALRGMDSATLWEGEVRRYKKGERGWRGGKCAEEREKNEWKRDNEGL